ncbi:hypothetical protein lbkm_2264 [Lachnospiraceae bacterium KM106-2]|nr:hypothetical protein lbkm_2264 [Lachnospiraceae bacterium KM106-2]
MRNLVIKVVRLLCGFLLCSAATVLALNSGLGLSPWDVLHQGLSKTIGITIGQASIAVSLIIIVLSISMKMQVGLGTIANIFIVGVMIDWINESGVIPVSHQLFSGILMLIASLLVMAVGCYLYIGCELGCGPRDGLMIALVKKTGKSIRLIRFGIECMAFAIGWLLGGTAGLGTIVTVVGMGYCMQAVFGLFHLDVSTLHHKSVTDYYKKRIVI